MFLLLISYADIIGTKNKDLQSFYYHKRFLVCASVNKQELPQNRSIGQHSFTVFFTESKDMNASSYNNYLRFICILNYLKNY